MSDMSGTGVADIAELLGTGTMGSRPMGEMTPLELLAQTIDRAVYAGVQDSAGAISGADIDRWADAVNDPSLNTSQQWAMAEQVRGDILAYRVGETAFNRAFGGGFEAATAAATGNQSSGTWSGGLDEHGRGIGELIRNPFANVNADDWTGGASVQGQGLQARGGDIAQNFANEQIDHPTALGYAPQGGTGPLPSTFKDSRGGTTTVEPGSLDVITSTLRRWGFNEEEISGLSLWVQAQLQSGIPVDSILILIYDQEEFQTRFPGMKAAKDAGFAPLSPGDYIEYEDSLREYVDKYLPGEVVGDLDKLMTTLMAGNISLQQVNERLQIAYDEILNAPVDVKGWFTERYGKDGDANLVTILLDPTSSFTDLEQRAKEAYTQVAASEILASTITEDTAKRIVNLGFSQEQQYRQFTSLTQQEHLFAEKLNEGTDMTIEGEGVEAAFGIDADSVEALERRKQTRAATAKGGGGAWVRGTQTGVGAANA
jgi:hypothetical protein